MHAPAALHCANPAHACAPRNACAPPARTLACAHACGSSMRTFAYVRIPARMYFCMDVHTQERLCRACTYLATLLPACLAALPPTLLLFACPLTRMLSCVHQMETQPRPRVHLPLLRRHRLRRSPHRDRGFSPCPRGRTAPRTSAHQPSTSCSGPAPTTS